MQPISTPMRPNRPHIPSFIQISKSADTKQTTHPNFGRLAVVYPDFVTSVPSRAPFRPSASLRLFVFGEALSRETRRHPQEEKCTKPSFSRHTQRLQGNSTPPDQSFSTRPNRPKRKFGVFSPCPPESNPNLTRIRRESGANPSRIRADDSPIQAKPAPRWVILPPAIVRLIAVVPRLPGAIASISPSISTRSAASPGTSLPVMPSICAAQAPPTV